MVGVPTDQKQSIHRLLGGDLTMTDSRKLAVELVVESHGLEVAEERIKAETDQHSGERYELLSHARKFADKEPEASV